MPCIIQNLADRLMLTRLWLNRADALTSQDNRVEIYAGRIDYLAGLHLVAIVDLDTWDRLHGRARVMQRAWHFVARLARGKLVNAAYPYVVEVHEIHDGERRVVRFWE